MANTYVWQFESLDVYPTYGSLANVVQSIHWRVTADDGSGHAAEGYGEQVIDPPDPGNFTPFASLTASLIQSWTEAAMGSELTALMAQLDSAIAQQITPTIVSMAPPW